MWLIAAGLDPSNLGLSALGATGALLVFLYFTRQALSSMKDRLTMVELQLTNAEEYVIDLTNTLVDQNIRVPHRKPVTFPRRLRQKEQP